MVKVPVWKISGAEMPWSRRCWIIAPATAESKSLAVRERLDSGAISVASISPNL